MFPLPPGKGRVKRYVTQRSFPIEQKELAKRTRKKRAATTQWPKPRVRNEAAKEDQGEHIRAERQPADAKERQRKYDANKRIMAKEQGLCRHCGDPAIEDQTRCETCAEEHRIQRRQNDANRHAKAKEDRLLQRTIALAEKIAAGGRTKCRRCKKPPRPGQTRCEQCAKRHIEYLRKSKDKRKAPAVGVAADK